MKPPADEKKADSIILSVRLRSGKFESSIEVPLFCTDEERQAFVEAWLQLMESGLRVGRSRGDG